MNLYFFFFCFSCLILTPSSSHSSTLSSTHSSTPLLTLPFLLFLPLPLPYPLSLPVTVFGNLNLVTTEWSFPLIHSLLYSIFILLPTSLTLPLPLPLPCPFLALPSHRLWQFEPNHHRMDFRHWLRPASNEPRARFPLHPRFA